MNIKRPYICCALTELSPSIQEEVKLFYSRLGTICHEHLGVRAFVPHEHYDPIVHAQFTPTQIDEAERKEVCENTNLLIVVAIEPTWGGGIEVEMAHQNKVPVLILKPRNKNISRLLRGNPAVRRIIEFADYEDAARQLAEELIKFRTKN